MQLGGIVCHNGGCDGTGKWLHPNSLFGGVVMATGNLRKRETKSFLFVLRQVMLFCHFVVSSFPSTSLYIF